MTISLVDLKRQYHRIKGEVDRAIAKILDDTSLQREGRQDRSDRISNTADVLMEDDLLKV